MPVKNTKVYCFKETDDNWYGNFRILDVRYTNTLLVCLSLFQLIDGEWRVSVWGNDDRGMELDLPDRDTAALAYMEFALKPKVNKDDLLQYGFEWA